MPAGDMTTDEVRAAALQALVRSEGYSAPELKDAWASIGAGYARVYAADVERGSS